MLSITASEASTLAHTAREELAFLEGLAARIIRVAEEDAGTRFVVSFDGTLDIGAALAFVPHERSYETSSFTLQGSTLLNVLEALEQPPTAHIRAMEDLLAAGYRIEAEAQKAPWADPLQHAPILTRWRICWEVPGANTGNQKCRSLISAFEARSRTTLPKRLTETLARLSGEIRQKTQQGANELLANDEDWTSDLCAAVIEKLHDAGFAAVQEVVDARSVLRVTWS